MEGSEWVGEKGDATGLAGPPSAPYAVATPPSQVTPGGGFQSMHGGGFSNGSSSSVSVTLSATLVDSVGNSTSTSVSDVAPANGSVTFNPAYCAFPLSQYTPGSTVTFTATTTVQGGGFSANDTQQNALTVPMPADAGAPDAGP